MNLPPRLLKYHYLVVFFLFPLSLYFLKPRGFIYFILWIMSFVAMHWLVNSNHYRLREDWNWAGLKASWKPIVLRFTPLAIALLGFTWFMIPERLFSLPLERPQTWVMVMLLYPLLSVFPQEILFRAFFFRYYEPWIKNERVMVLFNAFSFGWMHVFLHNWVAVVFSFIGGILFASTYKKTKSFAAVCFEHALYGCFIFTLGLGYYFYHGHAVR